MMYVMYNNNDIMNCDIGTHLSWYLYATKTINYLYYLYTQFTFCIHFADTA